MTLPLPPPPWSHQASVPPRPDPPAARGVRRLMVIGTVTLLAICAVSAAAWVQLRPSQNAAVPYPSSPTQASAPTSTPTPTDGGGFRLEMRLERVDRPGVPHAWYRMTANDGSFSMVAAAPGSVSGSEEDGWEVEMDAFSARCYLFVYSTTPLARGAATAHARRELLRWARSVGRPEGKPRLVRHGQTRAWLIPVLERGEPVELLAAEARGRLVLAYAGPTSYPPARVQGDLFLSSIRVPAEAP